MDERLRETLSAMMDDEADELSVRRLLSHSNQEDVRCQWQRWQQVRDLMHENHGPADGIDIAGAVRETLDGQAVKRVEAGGQNARRLPYWRWPVAAMVALALIVGFGAGAGFDTRPDQQTRALALSEVGTEPALPLSASVQVVPIQRLDQEQMQQMRQYLLEHAQHSSVGVGRGSVGYARVVSASGGQ